MFVCRDKGFLLAILSWREMGSKLRISPLLNAVVKAESQCDHG